VCSARELIRKISGAKPLWDTPRFIGELGMLGIEVTKSTVDKRDIASQAQRREITSRFGSADLASRI